MIARWVAGPMICLATIANAQTKEHAPVSLSSSRSMTQDKPNSESWTYVKPKLDLAKYKAVYIQPTAIYRGPDAQFDAISDEDKAKYAAILTNALDVELRKSFTIAPKPAAGVLDIRMTLLGAQKTKGGVATATRVTSFGLATNAIKSLAGKPGTFTGSLLLAIEVADGGNGELLAGAVRRRSPDALDIPATLSTTDTAKAVARDFAQKLREKLVEAQATPAGS